MNKPDIIRRVKLLFTDTDDIITKLCKSSFDIELIATVLNSYLTDEAKAKVILAYANSLYSDKTEFLNSDVVAFIKSLVRSTIPQYPLWCIPNYIPIINTRAEAETHYINRNKAIMTLGRAGDGDTELYRFITNYYDYMYVNSSCLCDMLFGKVTHTNKTIKNNNRLKIIKEFGAGKVGRAFMISDQNNNPYIMKTMNINLPNESPFTLELKEVSRGNPIAKAILIENNKIRVAGSDDFTNQTVLHILLNLFLDDSLNYIHQYDAFICGTAGINIMDIANEGDMYKYLNSLPTDTLQLEACEECLRQLLPILAYLKKPEIGFSHNDLKLKNVFVHKMADGKIIYRMADYDKSSISLRSIRFYNNSMDYISLAVTLPIPYNGISPAILLSGLSSIYTRTTAVMGKGVSLLTMYNAQGYYLGYDLYTLVASMLFHPGVYRAYLNKHTGFMHRVVKAINIGDTEGVSDFTTFMTVINRYMDPTRITTVTDLQSIQNINGLLHKNEIMIRNDYDNLLNELNIKSFKPSAAAKRFYEVTTEK